jgi:Exonuclease III
MLLISWNVAGLSTTLNRIDKDYSSSSNAAVRAAPKRSRSHAFAHFLKLHGDPDILCIQEHKIPLHQLSSRSEPFGCADLDGYESFWSCCVDKSRKGFNGVVTFVKRGMVQGANVRPLECDVLDDQGRAVLTDHGNFVVFNVYVPASCGMPLSYKMKFLNALRRAIKGQKGKGKKVILVGDLNISHTGIDVHWSYRSIPVRDLIHHGDDHVFKDGKDDEGNVWKQQVSRHWEMIQNALSTMEAIPITTKNVATGSTFQKYRARVTVKKLDLEKKVFLGGYESCVERCLSCFNFEEVTYYDEDLERECIARESNVVPLNTLAELMSKIAGIEWDVSTIRTISNSVANLKKSSPPAKWLSDVLKEDGMVDAFRHLFPNAEGRYTCWNQQTNCRFENIGTRIDYTIVDEALIQFLDNNGSQKLRCCHFSDETKNFGSEEAALHAAVASGLFQGASFEEGGLRLQHKGHWRLSLVKVTLVLSTLLHSTLIMLLYPCCSMKNLMKHTYLGRLLCKEKTLN